MKRKDWLTITFLITVFLLILPLALRIGYFMGEVYTYYFVKVLSV